MQTRKSFQLMFSVHSCKKKTKMLQCPLSKTHQMYFSYYFPLCWFSLTSTMENCRHGCCKFSKHQHHRNTILEPNSLYSDINNATMLSWALHVHKCIQKRLESSKDRQKFNVRKTLNHQIILTVLPLRWKQVEVSDKS